MTLNEMIELGDLDPKKFEGFTIGKGKKIYWYITPMPKSGLYRCLPIEENGKLGWARWVSGNIQVYRVPKL